MSAKAYRSAGVGERLHVASACSSLGRVLIARSASGICAVLIGDDENALRSDLAHRFSAAILVEEDAALAESARQVIACIDATGHQGTVLPLLDLRGTAFQLRVWEALRRIPAGQTTSYGDLAESIGAPRAVRAVAQACGANPVAVLVPCHRVIGANGTPTGYRWGIDRKKALLEKEARAA